MPFPCRQQKLDHNLKDCGKDADEVTECICNLCAAWRSFALSAPIPQYANCY